MFVVVFEPIQNFVATTVAGDWSRRLYHPPIVVVVVVVVVVVAIAVAIVGRPVLVQP